jgi:hypothetical protein
MIVSTGVWGVLALVLVMLAAYRKLKARAEDDTLHVSGSNWGVIDKQKTVARSMAQIDRWGITLTIVTVLYGLVLLGLYLKDVWVQGQKLGAF